MDLLRKCDQYQLDVVNWLAHRPFLLIGLVVLGCAVALAFETPH